MADWLVTVCASCRRAQCWHGDLLCDSASTAGTVDVPASQLDLEHREHPEHYSRENLLRICGDVEMIDG